MSVGASPRRRATDDADCRVQRRRRGCHRASQGRPVQVSDQDPPGQFHRGTIVDRSPFDRASNGGRGQFEGMHSDGHPSTSDFYCADLLGRVARALGKKFVRPPSLAVWHSPGSVDCAKRHRRLQLLLHSGVATQDVCLTEREGFEPPLRTRRRPHFECGSFSHSDTSPGYLDHATVGSTWSETPCDSVEPDAPRAQNHMPIGSSTTEGVRRHGRCAGASSSIAVPRKSSVAQPSRQATTVQLSMEATSIVRARSSRRADTSR